MPAAPQRGRYRLHRDGEVTRRRSGDPNPRGRLERPEGLFRLHPDLTAPGDLPFTRALELVSADWERQIADATISQILITRYMQDLRGLAVVLERLGRPRVADIDTNTVIVWMRLPKQNGEPPARNVMAVRRAGARAFFQTSFCLGLTDANPAKAVNLPDRTNRYVHALTTDQIRQLQRVARSSLHDTRRPALLALVMSGAAPVEVAAVTVDDVDIANERVWVHGGGYRYRDRWVPLIDEWCVQAIDQRVRAVVDDQDDGGNPPSDRRLLSSRQTSDDARAQMTELVTGILKSAGVYSPGVNRNESIREWCALQVFVETASVERVALRLGMASLDGAAHIVGYDWADELTLDVPPLHRRTETERP